VLIIVGEGVPHRELSHIGVRMSLIDRRCQTLRLDDERNTNGGCGMKFLLWCILLILCWPLALFALILYPIVWLLLLPFRIVGIAVDGVLELVTALITLPARVLRAV
jgi:hypothetical protein